MLTFSSDIRFRDAMLGTSDWFNVVLILDILKKNATPKWIDTMSKVLSNMLALVERTIPSIFAALLLYVETAVAQREILAPHTRVLTAVLDVYARFLDSGMQPTFDELVKRPAFGTLSFKDGPNVNRSIYLIRGGVR